MGKLRVYYACSENKWGVKMCHEVAQALWGGKRTKKHVHDESFEKRHSNSNERILAWKCVKF